MRLRNLGEWLFKTNSNHVIAIATVVGATAAVFYTCSANKQLKTMQDTLNEIRMNNQATAGQVNQVIGNLNWNATAAQGALNEMRTANDKVFKQNQETLQRTLNQSKAALDASIASSRVDLRAWLGPSGTTFKVQVGIVPQISTMITNTGRTPAFRVRTQVVSHAFRSDEQFVASYPTGRVDSDTTVFPGVHITTSAIPLPVTTQDAMNMLTTGERRLFFYGYVLYDDAFGSPRYSHFCEVLDRDLITYMSGGVTITGLFTHRACDVYNDAN